MWAFTWAPIHTTLNNKMPQDCRHVERIEKHWEGVSEARKQGPTLQPVQNFISRAGFEKPCKHTTFITYKLCHWHKYMSFLSQIFTIKLKVFVIYFLLAYWFLNSHPGACIMSCCQRTSCRSEHQPTVCIHSATDCVLTRSQPPFWIENSTWRFHVSPHVLTWATCHT